MCVAFDLCITLMNVGEICQVVTVARFAYGPVGRWVITTDIIYLLIILIHFCVDHSLATDFRSARYLSLPFQIYYMYTE